MRIEQLTNNYTNPLSMEELMEAHLFLPNDTSVASTYVTSIIESVVREFEKVCRRSFFINNYIVHFDALEGSIVIPVGNVQTVTGIEYERYDSSGNIEEVACDLAKFRIIKKENELKLLLLDSTAYQDGSNFEESVRVSFSAGLVSSALPFVFPTRYADLKAAFMQRIAYYVQNHGDEDNLLVAGDAVKFSMVANFSPLVRNTYSLYRKPLKVGY